MMKTVGWIGLILVGACLAGRANASQMSVQVRQGPLRSAPSFTGSVVATLAYGDRVATLEKRPGWIRVSFGEHTGWMHQSALTPKRIVLQSGDATAQTGASSEELALAGKGFNAEVEDQFKSQNKEADFAAVDRMEKRAVTPKALAEFRAKGELN